MSLFDFFKWRASDNRAEPKPLHQADGYGTPTPAPASAPLGAVPTGLTYKQKAAIAIAAATLVATPLAQKWEGYRGRAYYDPAHILTQCYGETKDVDPSRIYSKDECAVKLRKRMARDYAPPLLECVPAFIALKHTKKFGALLDASYNAGPVAACRSPMAKAFREGRWREGCLAFEGWYTTAKNRKTGVRKVYPGLVSRRKDEMALCLQGL